MGDDAVANSGEIIESMRDTVVMRLPGTLGGRDVSLRDLRGCRILVFDMIGALHCRSLSRCEIVIGAVSSSALLHDCRECVITLATKQLRVHDSEEVSFHLHTLSGPVIEHCKRILVSPFDVWYSELEKHWLSAALGAPPQHVAETSTGAWADVQDFNWLRRQASPNWCVVPVELRRDAVQFSDTAAASSLVPVPPPLAELDQGRRCWEAAEAAANGTTVNKNSCSAAIG